MQTNWFQAYFEVYLSCGHAYGMTDSINFDYMEKNKIFYYLATSGIGPIYSYLALDSLEHVLNPF